MTTPKILRDADHITRLWAKAANRVVGWVMRVLNI